MGLIDTLSTAGKLGKVAFAKKKTPQELVLEVFKGESDPKTAAQTFVKQIIVDNALDPNKDQLKIVKAIYKANPQLSRKAALWLAQNAL